jgi:regulator of protease activity HflC (stomatin/prohibitin superfamily)
VTTETKTKDDVTITITVAVQYQAIPDKVYDTFYKLSNAKFQIQAYVEDVVRSTLPRMDLDDAFEAKEDVAKAVKASLEKTMHEYGYQIMQVKVSTKTLEDPFGVDLVVSFRRLLLRISNPTIRWPKQ